MKSIYIYTVMWSVRLILVLQLRQIWESTDNSWFWRMLFHTILLKMFGEWSLNILNHIFFPLCDYNTLVWIREAQFVMFVCEGFRLKNRGKSCRNWRLIVQSASVSTWSHVSAAALNNAIAIADQNCYYWDKHLIKASKTKANFLKLPS